MRNLFWGFILIFLGILILLDNLGYADFQELLHDYWPLILVAWGVSIVIRRQSKPAGTQPPIAAGEPKAPPSAEQSSQSSQGGTQYSGDLLHQSNVFGDIFTRVESQTFRGGSVSTVFGDSTIDLTGAAFADGDHELRVHGVFGDSLILLPRDRAIAVAANSVFGTLDILGQHRGGFSSDIQTTTPDYSSVQSRLKITITRVFGDVRVQ